MTGCNQWDGGLDVVVEGDALQVTDQHLLERLADAWTEKWDGQWQFEAQDGGFRHEDGATAFVYSVRPRRSSHSARAASATRAIASDRALDFKFT